MRTVAGLMAELSKFPTNSRIVVEKVDGVPFINIHGPEMSFSNPTPEIGYIGVATFCNDHVAAVDNVKGRIFNQRN